MDAQEALKLLEQVEATLDTIYKQMLQQAPLALHPDWDYTRYEAQRCINHYYELIKKTELLIKWR